MIGLAVLCGSGLGFLPAGARAVEPPSAAPADLISDAPIEGRVDPDTYRVGPGDEFALRYSDLLDPKLIRVSPSGDLLLPDAGSVEVAGLTLREAETKIRGVLRPFVRGKGFVVALHRPRRFRLPVLGNVEHPGVVTLQAPVRASEAIAATGGIARGGARRGIQIRRGADTLRVDLTRYVRAGDLEANPLVFETDVVYVPAAGRRFEVQGTVPHPGRYDFLDGDRLTTIVALGGGPLPEAALAEAELARVGPDGAREVIPIRLAEALGSPGGPDDLPLSEGDALYIPGRSHYRENAWVRVEGEVVHPGPYPIEEGVDRVRSVLERAGGFTKLADRALVRVERRALPAEADTAFLGLAHGNGQILSPSDRSYVVLKARERNALSSPVGALLEAGDARGDVALRDGDRIVVPERIPLVSVQGEVRAPGFVPYEPGRRLEHYVRAAGDYTSRAYKSRTRVTLASTGRQVGPGEVREIHPGDTIWIPPKPERNAWGTVRDIVSATAAAAAIVLAVEAVRN